MSQKEQLFVSDWQSTPWVEATQLNDRVVRLEKEKKEIVRVEYINGVYPEWGEVNTNPFTGEPQTEVKNVINTWGSVEEVVLFPSTSFMQEPTKISEYTLQNEAQVAAD